MVASFQRSGVAATMMVDEDEEAPPADQEELQAAIGRHGGTASAAALAEAHARLVGLSVADAGLRYAQMHGTIAALRMSIASGASIASAASAASSQQAKERKSTTAAIVNEGATVRDSQVGLLLAVELTNALDCVKALFQKAFTPSHHDESVELYRRLRFLINLDALQDAGRMRTLRRRLCAPAMEAAITAVKDALTTVNPGGEPATREAQRQLLFFCTSLHNRSLRKPPPVVLSKSLTAFTPHYAEDVTYDLKALVTDIDDNVDLLHLLQSLFPDDWKHFTERLGVHQLQRPKRSTRTSCAGGRPTARRCSHARCAA